MFRHKAYPSQCSRHWAGTGAMLSAETGRRGMFSTLDMCLLPVTVSPRNSSAPEYCILPKTHISGGISLTPLMIVTDTELNNDDCPKVMTLHDLSSDGKVVRSFLRRINGKSPLPRPPSNPPMQEIYEPH